MSVAINCDRCGEYGTDVVYCNSCERKVKAAAIAEGRRLERAAIVADLRATRDESVWGEQAHDLLTMLAGRYERAEHEEDTR